MTVLRADFLTNRGSNSPKQPRLRLVREFQAPREAQIYHGDVLAFLRSIDDASSHLVFLDPPFNLGKAYGPSAIDSLPLPEYSLWMEKILDEAVRILVDGGALYLYHIPVWALTFGAHLKTRLDFKHWIAVSMKNGFVRGKRLYPAHYALLFFTKGDPIAFNRPRIPVDKCECGRAKKDYGGYRQIVDEKGINLSDVWDDLSPVRHRSKKCRIANELPSKLTDRVVAISGGEGLIFVDPFAGGGSAVIAAAKIGMNVKACDIVRANCLLQARALERLGFSEE
jgi:site-specific DNA-methyltransferase (adenine-specific)